MHSDPFLLFDRWYEDALRKESRLHDAVALSTAGADARPSVRMVLLKGHGPDGFRFFTNLGSRKAHELSENPHAVMLFHWKSLGRQVTIEGGVERLDRADDEAYFATRPRVSQIGAWASKQGQELPSRTDLVKRVARLGLKHAGAEVPCPEFWGGYRLVPDRFEFWRDETARLHERQEFLREGTSWTRRLIYP